MAHPFQSLTNEVTGKQFRARREAAGWPVRARVAGDIGVHESTVKRWENGKRKVPGYAVRWLLKMEARAKRD